MNVGVTQLARELDVTSYHILNVLRSMGEQVRSASSTIEGPVADAVRRQCTDLPTTSTPPARPHYELPATPAARANATPPLSPRSRREWYRPAIDGELSVFVRFLLDKHFAVDRATEPKTLPPSGYYRDEVESARTLARTWAAALLIMSMDEVLAWVRTDTGGSFLGNRLTVDDAIDLHARGIEPAEIEWSYEDRNWGTLGLRLANGLLTVDEVALEVEARRARNV